MKSLPRSPAPSTATTLTATMMAKAFQSNTHKRGLTEMMAPPPTPTAQSSTSYLDCQSLQCSLKRVRLSSSPGELRLQRDLRHLESSGTWQRVGNADVWHWHPPAAPVTARRRSPCTSTTAAVPRIELRQLESLRLRLTIPNSVVVWIQVPRMYPHRPPLVGRIAYNDESPDSHRIEHILVHEAPPGRAESDSQQQQSPTERENYHQDTGDVFVETSSSSWTSHSDSGEEQNTTLHYSADTIIYHDWSPVQRLGDLLEFVIGIFQRQGAGESSNGAIQGAGESSNVAVPLTYSSSSLSSGSNSNANSWIRRGSSGSLGNSYCAGGGCDGYRTSSSSLIYPGLTEEDDKPQDMVTMTTSKDEQSSIGEDFLDPKRFDVGYDRNKPPANMDVEDHHNLNSMMIEDL